MRFALSNKIMILYFDTETSGLKPGQICQLSYIMQTEKGFFSKNFFFTVDFVEMSAQLVHGFSVSKLKELSKGKRFKDFFDEIKSDFESADLIVAHNTAFDFSFMRKEYERLNEIFYIKNEFCSMKKSTPICKLLRKSGTGYKYPKLSELCEFLSINNAEILSFSRKAFDSECGFHDARFDTSAVCLAVNKMMKNGFFNELEEFL